MQPEIPSTPVRHNPAANRFEAGIEDHLAVLDYVLVGDRMIFTHTFVPAELRGCGLAEALVRPALGEARRTGRRVVPQCSYVARFIERHPEYRDLLG